MAKTNDSGSAAPHRHTEPPRSGAYKRVFAWILARLQDHYGAAIDDRKAQMLGGLHGTVVEIGAGAGANLRFYPAAAELLLVEPNAHLHAYLRREGERLDKPYQLCGGTAECMDVADDAADFVVATLVLCSVDDQPAALREVLRVLKPGGQFLFVEHVAAPRGSRLRRRQALLRRFWRAIGDGCTLDRETAASIEAAGFADCCVEQFAGEHLAIVSPHIAGCATKG